MIQMKLQRLRQSGFSLLEVLIATVVLAIGLVGIASLQLKSSVYTESSLHRSNASGLAREIFERMRVNYIASKAGQYDIGTLPTYTTNCEGVDLDCTPEQLREHDLRVWSHRLTNSLPGADASIITGPDDGENSVDIAVTIEWDQSRGQRVAVNQTFAFKLMGLSL